MRVAWAGLLVAVLGGGALSVRFGVLGTQHAAAPPLTGLAVDAADGSLLKAGGGLFRSTDRGRSWTALPIPAALHPGQLRQVVTSSAAPSSLYAAGPGAGVVRSDDGGTTWRSVGDGLPSQEVGAFTVHSFRPDTLYVWITGQGVFRTEDGGKGWQKMDAGPPQGGPPVPVVALAHSTLAGSMNTGWLYAATSDGPYLSMDCF